MDPFCRPYHMYQIQNHMSRADVLKTKGRDNAIIICHFLLKIVFSISIIFSIKFSTIGQLSVLLHRLPPINFQLKVKYNFATYIIAYDIPIKVSSG